MSLAESSELTDLLIRIKLDLGVLINTNIPKY